MEAIAFLIGFIISLPLIYLAFRLVKFIIGWYWKFLRCTLFYALRNFEDVCGSRTSYETVRGRELYRNYIYETPFFFFICLGLTEAIIAWFMTVLRLDRYLMNIYFATGFGFCCLYFLGMRKRFLVENEGSNNERGIVDGRMSEYMRLLITNRDFMRTCIIPISFVVSIIMFYLSAIAWDGLLTDHWSSVIIDLLMGKVTDLLGNLIYNKYVVFVMDFIFWVPGIFLAGYLLSVPFQFVSYYYVLIRIYCIEHQSERQELKDDIWWKRLIIGIKKLIQEGEK